MTRTTARSGLRGRKSQEYSVDQLLERAGMGRQRAGSAIPRTFFTSYAEAAPLVIHEGIVYQAAAVPDSDDRLVFAGAEFGLAMAGAVSDLEEFYQANNGEQIQKFKEAYIQEKTNQRLASHEEIRKKLGNSRTLGFIINEMIPYFEKDSASVDDVIAGTDAPVKTAQINVIDHILKEIDAKDAKLDPKKLREFEAEETAVDNELEGILSNYYRSRGIRPDVQRKAPLLQRLVSNDICTLGDTVYALERARGASPAVIIGGTAYGLRRLDTIENLEIQYQKALEQQFKREALQESKDYQKVLAKLEQEAKAFEKFAELKEFNHGDFGFVRKADDNYAVFLKVPEYVLKERNAEAYYHFPACKVAVNIRAHGNEVNHDQAYILGPAYAHPFTRPGDGSNQGICLGNFSYDRIASLPNAERIVKYLSVAKNVLMRGYNSGASPYRHLANMTDHLIKKEDIERRGLTVTNVNARGTRGGDEYDHRWDR